MIIIMENMHPADRAAKERLEKERAAYRNNKTASLFLAVFFPVFLFAILILHVALPDTDYSKRENKTLMQFSELSLDGLFEKDEKGQKKTDVEGYLQAQFPFRDQFIALDALRQIVLTFGKSNGVLLTYDGYLVPEEQVYTEGTPLNYTLLLNTVKAYEQSICFTGEYRTLVAVAGSKSQFALDAPFDHPQSALVQNRNQCTALLKECGERAVYLSSTVMKAYSSEQLYYRTDHHWTSLGAYYASAIILEQYGIKSAPLSVFDRQIATDSFRGTAYNASGLYFLSGDDLEYFRYEGDEDFTVSLCNPAGKVVSERKGFYDLSALEEEHMGTAYDSFVAGVSTPVVRITKEGEDRKTLLVIKDSFAHSALPFLAREFDLITVDLRAKNFSLPTLLEEGEIDGILVLVSQDTLLS